MRSITTRASEARVTCIRINQDGDLLFTAGSDGLVSVWRICDGQRLGTYHYIRDRPFDWTLRDLREEVMKPTKAVTCIDVNRSSTQLAVCRFDLVLVFHVATGQLMNFIEESSKVECCDWNKNPKIQDKLLLGVTGIGSINAAQPCFKIYQKKLPKRDAIAYGLEDDGHSGKSDDGTINQIRDDDPNSERDAEWVCIRELKDLDGVPTICAWGPLDRYIIGGTDRGKFYMWDAQTGKVVHMRSAHQDAITSISFNKNRSICLTVSRDKTAKLWNTFEFAVIKEIAVDRPLNACSLNPLFDEKDPAKRKTTMLLAGGQKAVDVTTTGASEGFFEVLIIDAVTGDEENRLLTHYSPTLCITHHPNGHIFATGAYEGNAKIFFTD